MVLLNGVLFRALVGVFVWCVVGFLVSSAIGIRIMYPFVRRIMVPKRKTPEGVVKGEFFSNRAVNTKELTWKEAFFEEGWKKFRMPALNIRDFKHNVNPYFGNCGFNRRGYHA